MTGGSFPARHKLIVAATCGLAGLAVGLLVTPVLQGDAPHRRATAPVVVRPASSERSVPLPEPSSPTLLVWTPGRLPDGGAEKMATLPGVQASTVVRGGTLGLVASWDGTGAAVDQPPAGFRIPLDAMVFDARTYPPFVPPSVRAAFAGLGPHQAILGTSSARLRHLGPGAALQLVDGSRVDVVAVVDDAYVGATEVALSATASLPARYVLLSYSGDRAALEQRIRQSLPNGTPVRFRAPGETPFLRQGDAVLAQVFIKERFGEFAYKPGPGREITEDPAWEAANVVNATVPILGHVRCNRTVVPQLRGALEELKRRNLASLVNPREFQGCWNPVLIDPGGDVSRHAWGVAVDINFGENPTGVYSGQDPRLVDVMQRWGFTWGGPWLIPDPAHFETLS